MVDVLGSRERLDELLEADSRRAIRVNPLKTTPSQLLDRLDALGVETEPVPFAENAYWADTGDDRSLGAIFEHQAGHFFLQDPVSTIPVDALDPTPGDRVLDLCAAPGSKTTHIGERLDQEGLLVANDKRPGRVHNLISNLDQTGLATTITTQVDACRVDWPITFDKVLVDAPCSNLGTMHQDWEPIRRYGDDLVGRLAGTQQSLLTSAFHAVDVGGRIVYSTCTIEPRENEAIADWFVDAYPVRAVEVAPDIGEPAHAEIAGETYDGAVEAGQRVWAGDHGTESFFVAAFEKEAQAAFDEARGLPRPDHHFERAEAGKLTELVDHYGLADTPLASSTLVESPNRTYAATVPDMDEALDLSPSRTGLYAATKEPMGPRLSVPAATLYGHDAENTLELDPNRARSWLAGNAVEAPPNTAVEWQVVTCNGEPIGCARPFGDELPCYVPKRVRLPENERLCGFLAVDGLES
jgi:16S rRNA (cytosine1407-C5)-methyltransferase